MLSCLTGIIAWLIDSGASHHMVPHRQLFLNLKKSVVEIVCLADGSTVPVLGQGDIVVQGPGGPVTIKDVLWVPQLSHCLFSVHAVYKNKRGKVLFGADQTRIYSKCSDRKPVLIAKSQGSGWEIRAKCLSFSDPEVTPSGQCTMCTGPKGEGEFCALSVRGSDLSKSKGSWQVWHARLGHPGLKQLKHLTEKGLATGIELEGDEPSKPTCIPCLEGKMSQLPYKSSATKAKAPFDLVHTDLMGPLEVPSVVYRSRYVLVVVDDFSRFSWVFFLKHKDESEDVLRRFFSYVKTQFNSQIKTLRSDNGGEFTSKPFSEWLDAQGVKHNLSIPYSPQQNGVAERFNRTLQERSRAMIFGSGLPVRYWEHAMRYASWCINRLPTTALPNMGVPYTALMGKAPSLAMAKVFGCMAHVWVPEERRPSGKFSKRSVWGVFIGIPQESKGWEFFLPESGDVGFLSRNAYFHEDTTYSQYKANDSSKVDPSDLSHSDSKPVTDWEDSFPKILMDSPQDDGVPTQQGGIEEGQFLGQTGTPMAGHSDFDPNLDPVSNAGQMNPNQEVLP